MSAPENIDPAASPTPTPAPTSAPVPEPTPIPTPSPVPVVNPEILGDTAAEQLAMLSSGTLVTHLFESIEPSVVGILVEAKPSDSNSVLTNRGSGVIYRDSGLIVTSADLFSIARNRYGELLPSTEIQVRVSGRVDPFPAQLVGQDKVTGVAVLKIEPGYFKLKPAVLTDNPALKIGQHVFFCSFPDDLIDDGYLTSGLINALYQPVRLETGMLVEMIRTDAPILPNGMGGPLINLAGKVVALSIKSELTDAYGSQNYATPANTVLAVANSLVESGYVSGRPWLGITVLKDESFAELQALYRFPDGLYVSHVVVDGPAYIADIRRGDIITAINDSAVDKHQSLSTALASHKVGDQIVLKVYRRADAKYYNIEVYLKAYVS
jgi:serine protease Do